MPNHATHSHSKRFSWMWNAFSPCHDDMGCMAGLLLWRSHTFRSLDQRASHNAIISLPHQGLDQHYPHATSSQHHHYQWQKAKTPPYKHVIAPYCTALVGLPSQIVVAVSKKIHHTTPPWRCHDRFFTTLAYICLPKTTPVNLSIKLPHSHNRKRWDHKKKKSNTKALIALIFKSLLFSRANPNLLLKSEEIAQTTQSTQQKSTTPMQLSR